MVIFSTKFAKTFFVQILRFISTKKNLTTLQKKKEEKKKKNTKKQKQIKNPTNQTNKTTPKPFTCLVSICPEWIIEDRIPHNYKSVWLVNHSLFVSKCSLSRSWYLEEITSQKLCTSPNSPLYAASNTPSLKHSQQKSHDGQQCLLCKPFALFLGFSFLFFFLLHFVSNHPIKPENGSAHNSFSALQTHMYFTYSIYLHQCKGMHVYGWALWN